jgi:membrane fusion protein (multidrug efflux system)
MQIREAAILVPEVALISNGDQYYVFLMGPGDVAAMQPVKLGERLPRWVEVTEGVKEGDRVVVEGHQKIAPGMKLAAAPAEKAAIYQTEDLRETRPEPAAVTR